MDNEAQIRRLMPSSLEAEQAVIQIENADIHSTLIANGIISVR